MKKLIGKKSAARLIIAICSIVLVYHFLIVSQILPYDYVWGGKLETLQAMYRFELISIFINILLIVVASMHAELFSTKTPKRLTGGVLWVLTFLLFGNTVANIFSESVWEAIIFTPVTLILALCCLRIVVRS